MGTMESYAIKQLNRRTYKETKDFRVWLEDIDHQLFIHVEIYNSTKASIKEIKEAWAELMIDCYFEGYEDVFAYTPDNRIIKLIGGAELIGTYENYEVWKWELK